MKSSYDTMAAAIKDLMRESSELGGKPVTYRIGGELYTAACPRPMTREAENLYWDEILKYLDEIDEQNKQ
jgi:hypothetical protein